MSRILTLGALLIGGLIIGWMGLAFVGTDLAALLVTMVIAAVYLVGFAELLRYQQATSALNQALSTQQDNVGSLAEWLKQLPASLQTGVRLRIEGEHVGLPAPVLAPYLIGLLVMLGLLGTFIGMVDTLQGAVTALQGSTELEAIRSGLAAPIQGLGMAFGTSVAGVAASAMLGFVATLSRRDRLLASRLLDSKVGSIFAEFSLNHNRQQTYKAMQQQAQVLPDVADKLTALVDKLEQMSERISSSLIDNQQQFHSETNRTYTELASAIDRSLQQSLSDSGRLAGESIQPVIEQMMQTISSDLKAGQQQLNHSAQQQLDTISQQFVSTTEQVSQAWQNGLRDHQASNSELVANVGNSLGEFKQQLVDSSNNLVATFDQASEQWLSRQQVSDQARLDHWSNAFEQASNTLQQTAERVNSSSEATASQLLAQINGLLQSSEQLVQTRIESESDWLASYNQRMEQMTSSVQTELQALRELEQNRGDAAVSRLADLQTAVAEHLTSLGNSLEEPMSKLIRSAAETPRAAAELFEKMRAELSQQMARENGLLEDRRETMQQLNSLSDSLLQATSGQREAIESLVHSATDTMQQVAGRFSEQIDTDALKLSSVADQFAGSATDMSSLGEAFGLAVQLFNDANTSLIDSLAGIEQSLQNSTTRSDEQLAYYIAQAREIIDHSVMSQQEIIDQLQLFKNSEPALAGEAC
jgi:Mg2+ and Co2+ transporter CorA